MGRVTAPTNTLQAKYQTWLMISLFSFLCLYPKEEDVVIEDFEEDSEAEGSGGEDDIRELRAKKLALARKIAEQQRRQEKIQVKPHWRS